MADTPLYNQRVRYAVFARRGGVVCGINRAVNFVRRQCVGPLTVDARSDGDAFRPNEAVMVIEGLFGELVNLETTYLGMLAFSGASSRMADIVRAADGVPVVDMSARHYPYEIIEQTAYAAAIGGASGTSTAAGHRYVQRWLGIGESGFIRVGKRDPIDFKLYGSIPHALNAVFEGSSVESAKAYFARFPDLPLNVLIDFEGRELDVCREAAHTFGKSLAAVRLDTHKARIHQGGHDQPVPEMVERILASAPDKNAAAQALEEYGFGAGVTVEAVFDVRRALDEAGAKHARIVVSSGFDAKKVAAFRNAGAPMDAIGTGSWMDFLMFTSDVTQVLNGERWIDRAKSGRGREITVPELDRRVAPR